MYISLKSILIGILCFLFLPSLSAQLRQQYILDKDWEFRLDKADTAWEKVSIPHTWNAQDGTTPKYFRGVGEYRYLLYISPEMLKKRAFLRFEAVSQVAEVSVNGQNIGTHRGGFNAFCFEITDRLKKGSNLIEVKVSNSEEEYIAPLEGDFTVFGGIYRPVSLLLLPEVCITPLDFASSGIYIRQKTNSERSHLSIQTKVDSGGKKTNSKLIVRTSLFDAKDELVGRQSTQESADEENALSFINTFDVGWTKVSSFVSCLRGDYER